MQLHVGGDGVPRHGRHASLGTVARRGRLVLAQDLAEPSKTAWGQEVSDSLRQPTQQILEARTL